MTLPADCAAAYRAVRLLGEGGCGRVYLCSQLKLDRLVAVKLLDASVAKGSDLERRFDREARITAGLNHEHVIEVIDHGAATGVPWIAYEYAPDGSVRDLLDRGALAVAEAVRVAEAVARALSAAHAKGIVHRDVKPENVLVTQGRVYKLTDFGVARWAGKGSISTAAGVVLGTPAYLAPEVLRGDEPGPQSDLYALAVMLHEMIAGRLPFDAPALRELLELHLLAPPPPLPAGGELAALVARGLAKDPRERFANALEMAESLARVPLDGSAPRRNDATRALTAGARPAATRVAARGEPGPRAVPRMALVAGAGLLVVGLALAPRWRAPEPAPPTAATPTAATPAPSNLAAIEREAHALSWDLFRLQTELDGRPKDELGLEKAPPLQRQLREAESHAGKLARLVERLSGEPASTPALWLEIAVYGRSAIHALHETAPASPGQARTGTPNRFVRTLLEALRRNDVRPAARIALAAAELELATHRETQDKILKKAQALLDRLRAIPVGNDPIVDCHLGKSWFFLTLTLARLSPPPVAQPLLETMKKGAALAQVRVGVSTLASWDKIPTDMTPADRVLEGLDGASRALARPLEPAERALALAGARFLLVCAPGELKNYRDGDTRKLVVELRGRAPELPPLGTGVTPEVLAAERAKVAPYLDSH